MENIKQKPSVYSYTPGMIMGMVDTKREKKNRLPGEDIVIQALFGYRYLTKSLIKKNLKVYGHSRLDGEKIIRAMVTRGISDRYRIKDRNFPDTDFFCLSEEAMQENYGTETFEVRDIPNILENLSLSQFHMGALNSKMTRQYLHNYEESFEEGTLYIPSIIRMKNRETLFISALPSPRGKTQDHILSFTKQLILMDAYMKEKQNIFKSYIHVVICESESQIKDLSKLLMTAQPTRDMLILYSLDEESNGERNPLERLHRVIWLEDEKMETQIINLLAR